MTDCISMRDHLRATLPNVTRRATLGGLSAAVALGHSSLSFGAGATPARLIVLNIRGGLDGIDTIIPYGDHSLAGLRSELVPADMIKVGNFFALHPALVNFHAMMVAGEASAVHAVGPTVADRSHFAGQDYLQSGCGQLLTSGWLNRALGMLGGTSNGLSLSPQTPLILRGPVMTAGFAPEPYNQTSSRVTTMLPALFAPDALIGPADRAGLSDRALFNTILDTTSNTAGGDLPTLAKIAGRLLGASDGPRIAVLETDSVDTHDNQKARLPAMLTAIDNTFAALKSGLGAAWSNTVVMTMTEFGRTAYENGTQGTDHGTAFAVLLAGGAVNGGTVIAKWPGLTTAQLFQGRDLAPTVDFRAVAMGLLSSHMQLSNAVMPTIFPGSTGIVPVSGLTKS